MPAALASCSTCGTTLTAHGDCLPCLVRVGFEATDGAPATFGEYQIERRDDGSSVELGRGAMGVTYRATDTVLNRKVALKVIEVPIARRTCAIVFCAKRAPRPRSDIRMSLACFTSALRLTASVAITRWSWWRAKRSRRSSGGKVR